MSGFPEASPGPATPRRALETDPAPNAVGGAGARRALAPERSFGSAVGWTVLGTLIPGLGLLRGGRRVLGSAILLLDVLVLGGLAYVAFGARSQLTTWLVSPAVLIGLAVTLAVLAVGLVLVVGATHLSLRPSSPTVAQRVGGAALVGLLSFLVAAPLAIGSQYSYTTANFLSTVFAEDDPGTSPSAVPVDPWATKDRLNVLVLGGDTEKDRDPRLGLRADSVMVASIDTHTGATTLFSLPRQTARIPFPEDSPLHDYYPNGFYDGVSGDNAEYFLNAMYKNIPPRLPKGLLGKNVKNVGAEVMKIGVGEALGLGKLDYYVAFSMDGFKEFINAIGGVTLNVNYRIPIGGNSSKGIPPSDWIEPGADQHMNGRRALWYARGRYSLNDYSRIERQRCVINAVVEQTKPDVVLTRFNAIASAGANNIFTDVPRSMLPSLLDLALKVKGTKLHSVVFKPGVANWVSADPDWPTIRKLVKTALKETAADAIATPTPSATATTSGKPTKTPTPSKTPTTKSDDLTDSCAYNPAPFEK